MPTVESVRRRMRDAWLESGLTQRELGERMGLSPSSASTVVARLFSDTADRIPRLDSILAIAQALRISPSEFFSDS